MLWLLIRGLFGLTAISRCLRPQTRFYSFLISGPRRCALVRAPLISALVAALRSSHSDSFLTSVRELKDGGREVGELLGAGLPLELASSKNPFIESLKEFVPQLVP